MNILNRNTLIIASLVTISIFLFVNTRIKAVEINELNALIEKQSGIAQELNQQAQELAKIAQESAAEATLAQREAEKNLELANDLKTKLMACESK